MSSFDGGFIGCASGHVEIRWTEGAQCPLCEARAKLIEIRREARQLFRIIELEATDGPTT